MLSFLPLYKTTVKILCSEFYTFTIRYFAGGYDPNRGAGFGGGGGGSIRSAGGAFAKLESVREEQFFINQQNDLIRRLKIKRITFDEYDIERLKVLQEYSKLVEQLKK